jgi:hypothetical protein
MSSAKNSSPWFPLLVFAALAIASVPFSTGGRLIGSSTGWGVFGGMAHYGPHAALLWLVAMPLGYATTAWYYVQRERWLGPAGPPAGMVISGLGLFAVTQRGPRTPPDLRQPGHVRPETVVTNQLRRHPHLRVVPGWRDHAIPPEHHTGHDESRPTAPVRRLPTRAALSPRPPAALRYDRSHTTCRHAANRRESRKAARMTPHRFTRPDSGLAVA